MAKLTLTDITAGYDTATVNAANNLLIETALENTLSRDGTSPNQMEANLDMNSYRIQNLPTAVNNTEPVILSQANTLAGVDNPLTQNSIGTTLWPQTAAETSAAITPTNYYYAPGNAKRYGATGDGTTDDASALQDWLDCGESYLVLPPGTYALGVAISLAETSGVGKIEGQGMPVLKRDDAVGTSAILSIYDENEVEITGIIFDGNQTGIAPVADPTAWVDLAIIATLTAAPNTTNQVAYFVTISNCQFRDSPGSCIAGAGMQNTVIQGCRFEEWLDHAVYMSGDSGATRGLGTSCVIDSNLFYCSANANWACKVSDNSRKYVVSNNVFDLTDEGCISITPGSAEHPREVVFQGNAGTCSQVSDFSGTTSAPNSDEGHYLFADNNMTCSDRGFYIGDSASSTFSGHLHIKGGTYRNSAGAFKAFLDSRFFDNANSETSIIMDGVSLKDFAVQQGKWPKIFVMKNCVCDKTFGAWFLRTGADDTTVKHIQIEGNQFLNAASGQGACQLEIHDDSTLIVRDNFYDTDGVAMNLRDFPEIVIFEGNTCVDVDGITMDASATARASAGTLTMKNNKMISTAGASVNVRLFQENTSTGCLLDNYNVFCTGNYFRDSTGGLSCIGTGVTGYSGSNVFYANGNFGTGSSFTVQYPAANESSFLPSYQIITEYTITNDATDRTFDANGNDVLELADVVATLLKDLGHGA